MPDSIYEVVAQAARYWFLFLMALIVWRSYRWFARDRRQRKKRLRLLPDAGYVGELVVIKGNAELPEGLALPVSNEGVLGNIRGDDVYVPVKGVFKKHLWYEFDAEEGLRLEPFGRRTAEVDGRAIAGRRQTACMTHGSRLAVGDAILRLRLFAGFEYAGANRAPFEDETAVTLESEPKAENFAAPMAAPPANGAAFTPEQLAALQQMQQMQWMSAWQAMQAQGMTQPVAPQPFAAAPSVLSTEKGDFIAPAGAIPAGPILQTEADAAYAEPRAAQERQAREWAADQTAGNIEETAQPDHGTQADIANGYSGRHSRRSVLPPVNAETAHAPQAGTHAGDAQFADAVPPFAEAAAVQTQENRIASGGSDAPADAHEDHYAARRALDEGFAFSTNDGPLTENATFAPHITFYSPVLDDETDRGAPLPDEAESQPESEQADDPWPYIPYPQSSARFENKGYTYPEYIESGEEPYEYADEDEAPRSLYVETDEAAKAKSLLWDRYLKGGRRQ